MTIDVNVTLFRHPTRRLPWDESGKLAEQLRIRGVAQAWAGSFEGLLHRDLAGVNQRLTDECRAVDPDLLRPFGTINPLQPDWPEDLRRCLEDHRMSGIRLFPSYHGYGLESQEFRNLAAAAAEHGVLVQIAARIEDPRTQHPLLQIADVDLRPLAGLLRVIPGLRVIVLNGLMSTAAGLCGELAQAGKVYWEISTLEGVHGINRILQSVPGDRLLFGSHAPFFVWEAADLKLTESELPQPQIELIREGNARALLPA